MGLRLLAVGDIHLGRRPSRLPGELANEAAELSPASAWNRLVNLAIQEGVHAVVLAGDVVEREDDFYEAYRQLRSGVERLAGAGIQVIGVAGNHDVHVLPRLADQIADFQLLGRNGEWETATLQNEGEQITLHGWSFRQAQVRRSPLDGVRLSRGVGLNLGLLHCDRDQPNSPYAPVTSRELESAGLDGWMLGHIHAPDALALENPIGYLGCVSGMDSGEPGDHGPWLFSIEGGRIQSLEQWVLAPLRWEVLELDLTDLSEPEEARSRLVQQVRKLDEEIAAKTQPPEAVGLRVRFIGRTDYGREVGSLFHQDEHHIVYDGAANTRYFIERCLFEIRPEIALEELAQRSDPPGLLARRLCLLSDPEQEEARKMITGAREILEKQRRDVRWQALDPAPIDDAAVVDWLRRSGTRLLEDMLNQQERAM